MLASTVLLFSLLVADTAEGTGSNQSDVRIQQVANAWQHRSSAFAGGVVEWEYDQSVLGRFESYWVPTNAEAADELQGVFQFSANAIQYDSRSTEYPVLGNRLSQTSEREYYRTALLSHFPDENAHRRKLLDYSITLNSDELLHFWQDRDTDGAEYPRTIVLPQSAITSMAPLARACGFASDSYDHLSGVPSPVLHQLCTLPCLLTFRPSLFEDRVAGMLDGDKLKLESHSFNSSLVTLILPADGSVEGGIEWVLACDPKLGFAVRRLLGKIDGKAIVQCDVSYDKHENGHWVPLEWTVQIIGDDPSFVRQAVTAKRIRIDLSERTSRELEIANLSGTWINDLTDNRQFLVLDDGQHWEIPDGKASWLSYEQTVTMSRGESPVGVMTDSDWPTKRKVIAAMTQWPGLLFPLSILGGGMFIAIRLLAPKTTAAQNVTAAAKED